MNNLKMYLALIALMLPLLLYAKERHVNIELEHKNHRASTELLIPVKASIDDSNKELTIEFFQEWEPITIEIKTLKGDVIYINYFTPTSCSTISIPLKDITSGTYKLVISDATQSMAGIFIY